MANLSVCMIVKNEERFLEEALSSIKNLADEIIIVDTGSTDATRTIARKFTDKIYDFAWIDDFSAARNFSLRQATKEWILVLDGDEVISKKDHNLIKAIIEEGKYTLVSLIQRNYTTNKHQPLFKPIDERYKDDAKGLPGYVPVDIIRLFKNNLGIAFHGAVHETVDATMRKLRLKFMRTDIPIHHYQHLKPQQSHEEKLKRYLALLEKNEQQYPDNIKNLHDLALVYLEQKKDLHKAFLYFRKIHEKKQDLLEPYLGMGLIFARLKKYDKAITMFTKGLNNKTIKTIELRTTHERIRQTILYNLAHCYTSLGAKAKAKECYELLLKTTYPMQEKIREQLASL